MSTAIYYFSGTGNSLYVAKDIAEGTGGTLVPIASLTDREVINLDTDVAGIIFPVYYGELPVIIRDFAQRLDNLDGKYIFAVCTFGGSAGDSLRMLRSIIQSRGGELSATYGVHMPQNAFYKFWEKHEPLYRGWRRRLRTVVENTAAGRKGDFFTNLLFDMIFKAIQAYVRPRYRQSFLKLSNGPENAPLDELIHLNDTSFSVTKECNGCGVCVQVCPVNNIEIAEGRPVWLHRCENCIACYNSCPARAIRNGIAAEGYYYHHPDISIREIMAQKQSSE